MFHAYIRRFDVMDTVQKILGTKQTEPMLRPVANTSAFPSSIQGTLPDRITVQSYHKRKTVRGRISAWSIIQNFGFRQS